MINKFFTVEVKPTLPVATQIQSNKTDLVFAAGDVLFDWGSFDIRKGANRLLDINCIVRGAQTTKPIQFVFAKANTDNSAPSSIGTGNATADGTGYYKNVLGSIVMDDTNFKVGGSTTMDNLTVGSLGHGAGADQSSNLVLEGTPNSGTNVGYDKLYVAAMASAGSGWNFSTGVLANAAVTLGAASTFVTKTVDPRLFFDVGDIVHVHDSDTAIGTVSSLTDNDINLEAVTTVAIAEDDEIINASPITLILSFEK